MVYISLDFSFFPLNFPLFLGIDHLENVSMRYRYPKVLGYRVLGIDIDPALPNTTITIIIIIIMASRAWGKARAMGKIAGNAGTLTGLSIFT